VRPAFVDCHSHVCPSGDDGDATVAEGAVLCREAAKRGTSILYATPHVWPHLTLTRAREENVRRDFAKLVSHAGMDVRLGFELTPARPLLDEDLRRYVLDGSDCILVEVPFAGSARLLWAVAEEAERQGFRPVIAHPERTEAVMEDERLADELGERYTLQVNATSLLGRHGPTPEGIGWRLLEEGRAALVASDGHRLARPPFLDDAYELVAARLGAERAAPFFDGSALGVTAAAPPAPSREAQRGA
jgi:protein-tyrosine phosphatase